MASKQVSEVVETIRNFNFLEGDYSKTEEIRLQLIISDPHKKIKNFKGGNFKRMIPEYITSVRQYMDIRSYPFPKDAQKQRKINGKIEQLVTAAFSTINSPGINVATLEIIIKIEGKEILNEVLNCKMDNDNNSQIYSTEDFSQSTAKNFSDFKETFEFLEKQVQVHVIQGHWNISKKILEVNPEVEIISFEKNSPDLIMYTCSKKIIGSYNSYEFKFKTEKDIIKIDYGLDCYFRRDGKVAHNLFNPNQAYKDIIFIECDKYDPAWMDINTAIEKSDIFFSSSREEEEEYD